MCVTPALQCTRRYCPSGSSLIFERFFFVYECVACQLVVEKEPIIVNFVLRCSSQDGITHVHYSGITLHHAVFIGSVCGTSCVEFWNNMRPGYGTFPHSSVEDAIMRLHEASLTFTNAFWSPLIGGLLEDFYCFIFLKASASSLSLA